jgi:hypothetical protein
MPPLHQLTGEQLHALIFEGNLSDDEHAAHQRKGVPVKNCSWCCGFQLKSSCYRTRMGNLTALNYQYM